MVKVEMFKLYKGDCLEIMSNIPDKSVDLVLCDLPYGLTNCSWDTIIPFEPLWKQYRRVLKTNGTAILFGNQPFMSDLINSNKSEYSHTWYWKKKNVTGALLARKMPMRCIEEIAVFRGNAAGKTTRIGIRI